MTEGLNSPGLTSRMELYDSEIIEIQKVVESLDDRRTNGKVSYEAFTNEIHDKFGKIGLKVSVLWYEMGNTLPDGTVRKVDGVLMPEIVIKDRLQKTVFDHDQQRHEIVNNILGMPDQTKGQLIKATPDDFKKLFGGGGHGHDH